MSIYPRRGPINTDDLWAAINPLQPKVGKVSQPLGEDGGTGLRRPPQGTTQALGRPGCSRRGLLCPLWRRHLP